MAVIPLTELAALEEACIVFWKQKNSAKAFGTASCMNSKLWRGIWGTQKSLSTFAHTCKTHTPYTRLLGNRMFTSTSTGCYQALCNLITIQYCNKVIFQPDGCEIESNIDLVPFDLGNHAVLFDFDNITTFIWMNFPLPSFAEQRMQLHPKQIPPAWTAWSLCNSEKCIMHTPRPRHVTNERHLGEQPDAILFYNLCSSQTFRDKLFQSPEQQSATCKPMYITR